jgi:hypothetical protein
MSKENEQPRSVGSRTDLRPPLSWPDNKPFRILFIDGGGIRGVLPASILARFERTLLRGKSAGDYFDLIAGTSTGGIIAIALAIGLPASQVLKLYIDNGEKIFPPVRGPLKWIQRQHRFLTSLLNYQYERKPLEETLKSILGDRTVGETLRRLCIPSFDGKFGEVHIFKTPHHPDFKLDWKEKLVTAALATSAAPTFFTVYKEQQRRFGDGGVWANNPIMVGLVEALTSYNLKRRNIQIMSLGCAESGFIVDGWQLTGGLWQWRKVIASAMHLTSQNALGQARLLVGADQVLRIDAPQSPGNAIDMDDYDRSIAGLIPEGEKLAEQYENVARERFFSSMVEPYEAFHGPRAQQ